MGTIIALTIIRELLTAVKTATNLPIYLGVYFLANGVLSFKQAREDANKSVLGPLASIIGGLILVATYPFSSYRETLVASDLGRIAFGAIVIVIGFLQVIGSIHMTPEPILKNVHLVFGFLEILLGVVVMLLPIAWEAYAVGFVWVSAVAAYMLYVAFQLRKKESGKI